MDTDAESSVVTAPGVAPSDQVRDGIITAMIEAGGPWQWLDANVIQKGQEYIAEVAAKLLASYPQEARYMYQTQKVLPSVVADGHAATNPLCVHLCALGLEASCSAKPTPTKCQATQLINEMWMDGFITTREPLIVYQKRQATMNLPACAQWVLQLGICER